MTGVILAGGQNRRMEGKMKSFLTFGKETFLERQISRMKTVCWKMIIVTNQPALFSFLDQDDAIQVINDNIPGKGPLSGIHAAISCTKGEDLWVVACDMPYISPDAARILWTQQKKGNYDAAVPVIDGNIHSLHGVYNSRIMPKLEESLHHTEFKVKAFLNKINWIPVHDDQLKQIDPQFVMNLNTPQEYQHALQLHKSRV